MKITGHKKLDAALLVILISVVVLRQLYLHFPEFAQKFDEESNAVAIAAGVKDQTCDDKLYPFPRRVEKLAAEDRQLLCDQIDADKAAWDSALAIELEKMRDDLPRSFVDDKQELLQSASLNVIDHARNHGNNYGHVFGADIDPSRNIAHCLMFEAADKCLMRAKELREETVQGIFDTAIKETLSTNQQEVLQERSDLAQSMIQCVLKKSAVANLKSYDLLNLARRYRNYKASLTSEERSKLDEGMFQLKGIVNDCGTASLSAAATAGVAVGQ